MLIVAFLVVVFVAVVHVVVVVIDPRNLPLSLVKIRSGTAEKSLTLSLRWW